MARNTCPPDLTAGKQFDRLSGTWLSPEEKAQVDAYREELAFMRRPQQGELCCPMIITDSLGFRGVQSQIDGRHYDSKSQLRRHYRNEGFIEVGNDVPKGRFVHGKPPADEYAVKRDIDKAVGQAAAKVETMSDETIKRRQFERKQRAHKVQVEG